MNSIQSILVVCLLAFATCDAKILSRRELQARELPPKCGTCNLAGIKLDELIKTITKLGPLLQKVTDLLGKLLAATTTGLPDLKVAIKTDLIIVRDNIGSVLDEAYAAVKDLIACPALKTLIEKMKANLYAILNTLINEWQPIINAPDLVTTLAALSTALQKALPDVFKLVRDAAFYLLEILGLCALGQAVWGIFDPPNAILFGIVQLVLSLLGGKAGLTFLTGLFGGLTGLLTPALQLPGAAPGTDILQTVIQLLCGLLKAILNALGLGLDALSRIPIVGELLKCTPIG